VAPGGCAVNAPEPDVTDYLSDILDVLRGIETVLTEIRDDAAKERAR
jgi:hypothetical protein